MDYEELLEHFIERGLDRQTASRLAEAIFDAGGVDSVAQLLNSL